MSSLLPLGHSPNLKLQILARSILGELVQQVKKMILLTKLLQFVEAL